MPTLVASLACDDYLHDDPCTYYVCKRYNSLKRALDRGHFQEDDLWRKLEEYAQDLDLSNQHYRDILRGLALDDL